jgi:pimeloyl-ACP methyl ester carboxylesterase
MTAADQVKGHGLQLPDGHWLGFHIYGDPGGTPILFLHGTPGSRLKSSPSPTRSAGNGPR